MTKGTAVFSYGLLGPVFSGGLRAIAAETKLMGWHSPVYRWTDGRKAAQAVRDEINDDDPVALIFHSAGATFANRFAAAFGRKIDLGISVDAWFPLEMARNFDRVISVKALTRGRFHVWGANVQAHVIIDGTHTTIDDSQELRKLVCNELAALS